MNPKTEPAISLKERTLTMTDRICGFEQVCKLRGKYKVIRDIPIVYRWWFPADSEVVEYIITHYPNKYGVKSIEEILPRIKKKKIAGKGLFYALYLGQSEDGHNRFSQHSTGTIYKSTLRKTIAALCFADVEDVNVQKKKISALLDECYFEWVDFPEDAELVETIEAQCIAVGCYPLNLDANRSVDEKWINHVMALREKIKD